LTIVVAKSSILTVGTTKRKTVINAEASQIERVQPLIEAGRYRTLSEFVREAMDEKLQRIERERLAEAVERYCTAGHAVEDLDLIDAQAFDRKQPSRKPRGSGRAKR
jgi:Arc/MetJ-type ribon-helix-helix transcriptional regulator